MTVNYELKGRLLRHYSKISLVGLRNVKTLFHVIMQSNSLMHDLWNREQKCWS